jgi:hypothetical protein
VCGNRTGTAGTVTFCLSGTVTGMHYGYRTGFGSGSNIKCNKKVKNQKGEANFLENNAASDIEKARFCTIFCCWKTVLGQSILRGFL